MNEQEQLLITVRTYPTISAKYIETVCTAGITRAGEWRRLYPVPWRYLEEDQRYRLWDEIRVTTGPVHGGDTRRESRRPENQTIEVVRRVQQASTRYNWIAPTVAESVEQLISEDRSIGPVRVREVLDFLAEPDAPDWSEAEKQKMAQESLFDDRKPLEKVPFLFRVRWRDGTGQEHNSMFRSWEVYQTWRSWRWKYQDTIERMRDKWLNERWTSGKEVLFFMGNMASRRRVFMICGSFEARRTDIHESLF